MAVFRRGVKNAFRNTIRSVSITSILALTVALALVMLLSMKAVEARIDEVKSDVGTTITVSPAGARGFAGGGDPLSDTELTKIESTPHVVAVAKTLSDRLRTEGATAGGGPGGATNANATTNLVSAIDAGALGRRFGANGGGQTGGTLPGGAGQQPPIDLSNVALPITITGTTDPTSTQVSGVSKFTLTAGALIDGMSNAKTALIGTDLAKKNGLSVGSTFTAYGQTISVAGIFDTGNTFTNGGVILPIAAVQELSNQPDAVTTALVKVDSIGHLAATTTALQEALGSAADVVSDSTNSETTLSSLNNVKTISGYSLLGALVAGAVIIFLSMLMIVRERRREIGVLKAIGSSNSKIALQFVVEALTLTMMAAVVGVIAGIVLSNPVLDVLVRNSTTTAATATVQGPRGAFGGGGLGNVTQGSRPIGAGGGAGFAPGGISRGVTQFGGALSNVQASVGFSIVLYGLLAAAIIAIAGSAIPAWLIAKVRPAEVMRSE